MFLPKWENFTANSFFTLSDRCQYLLSRDTRHSRKFHACPRPSIVIGEQGDDTYLHLATTPGNTTPAVYTAWKIPSKLTRRVISLISTGAMRFSRSFLWTHKKLISTIGTSLRRRKHRMQQSVMRSREDASIPYSFELSLRVSILLGFFNRFSKFARLPREDDSRIWAIFTEDPESTVSLVSIYVLYWIVLSLSLALSRMTETIFYFS